MSHRDVSVSLTLSPDLYARIRARCEAKHYSSVETYIVDVLKAMLSGPEGKPVEPSSQEDDEEILEKRLRALGYI